MKSLRFLFCLASASLLATGIAQAGDKEKAKEEPAASCCGAAGKDAKAGCCKEAKDSKDCCAGEKAKSEKKEETKEGKK